MLVVDLPHPIRIAWDPDLRKGDELTSSVSSFFDEVDGLLDAGFEVEPAWLGSDSCGFVLGERHCDDLVIKMCVNDCLVLNIV